MACTGTIILAKVLFVFDFPIPTVNVLFLVMIHVVHAQKVSYLLLHVTIMYMYVMFLLNITTFNGLTIAPKK